PGFAAYELLRTCDGVASIPVCEDEAAAVEAGRRVAAWITPNLPGLLPGPPEISAGEVFVRATRRGRRSPISHGAPIYRSAIVALKGIPSLAAFIISAR